MSAKTLTSLLIGILAIFLSACAVDAQASPVTMESVDQSPLIQPPPQAPSEPAALTYPIVDTGQDDCFGTSSAIPCPSTGQAFAGQDAQYNGNQPSYTLSADGLTVNDNITGLTWTQSPDLNGDGDIDVDDKLSFAEAQAYPSTLNAQNYGGYNDWRLPSIKELYSLMNFSGTDPSGPGATDAIPFIDTDYFDFGYGDTSAGERIIDAQFWSSNIYVGTVFDNQTATFGLNLADGRIKGYSSGTSGFTKLNYVYFVRGNSSYGLNDFVANGDGTITDQATGLMWLQADSGTGMKWEDALAWMEQKNAENYLGYSDWRLPNAKELQSIVDYARSPDTTDSAAVDPLFATTEITNEAGQSDYPYYWSSTTHLKANGMGDASVYIAFGRGLGSMDGTNAIDVHGAGCQRSDPKDGDPDDYPTFFGPQGDVRRVFNYVRLVRDVNETSEQNHTEYLPLLTQQNDSVAVQTPPPDIGQPPEIDLSDAAERLGVSEQELRDALGPPPPDLEASAQTLSVTVADLRAALGIPGAGAQP